MTAPLTPTDWIDNTGTVPDGVEAGVKLQLQYRDGGIITFTSFSKHQPMWELKGLASDILRWRKVQP